MIMVMMIGPMILEIHCSGVPRYSRKFRPTSQTQHIPATPRAYVVIDYSSTAPCSSLSSPSLSASSFFFTISSSSSPIHLRSTYRYTFRDREAIGFRRMLPPNIIISAPETIRRHLSAISTLRHANVVPLIGASVSEIKESFTMVDLIYTFVPGPALSDCLNPRGDTAVDTNEPYRYVSTWKSRMEIALGVASGLVYIHHMTGFDLVFIHNRIKSSNIIISSAISGHSQLIRAKICGFGLSRSTWHAVNTNDDDSSSVPLLQGSVKRPIPTEDNNEESYPYMAPELFHPGIVTQKSDVYSFGVLMLELLSGARPSTHIYEEAAPLRTSIVETAREIFTHDLEEEEAEEIEKRVRLWVDKRLNESFPVKITVELLRVALTCVVEDPASRPDMVSVEGFLFQCIRSFKTRSFQTENGVLSGWLSFLRGT